ncbi:MAG: tetratricopeptide repeat protein [Elusimicrobia bacterium]|nr:tetratricopeptide repeat protein [Elusimicrobiota bacterium]
MKATEALEPLGHWEKLEELSRRFATPHAPEYELEYFRKLYHAELLSALAAAEEELARGETAAALAARGRIRRLLGDAAGACEDLKRALDLDARCAAAHAFLGELDLTRPEAEASLTRAIALDGRLACAYLYRGACRLLRDDAAGASRDLRRLLELKPASALGRLMLGLTLEELGRPRAAASAYAAAARANPVCSAAYLLGCRTAAGPRELALCFRRAYDVSPVLGFITLQIHRTLRVESPAYIRRILGFCFDHPETVGAYYRREATQSHFSHFPAEDYGFVAKLVKANPRLSWTHAFFGRAACYTQGGAVEGVRQLSRAIALAPHAGWAYAWRANARRINGDAAGALKDFDAAIRLQPFYHRSFVWRGSLYRKLNRLNEALADLDRAIAMDPYYSLTYHERSLVRRGLGDFVGSAFDLDQAFLLDHRYSWVFKTGAEPSAEETAKGLAQLAVAIKAQPRVASLRVWRGQLLLQKRDWSAALLAFEDALTLDPHHFLGHGWRGKALLESGQAEAAARSLRVALRYEPRFWVAHGWLAEALAAQGRAGQAFACLEGVLKSKPKTPWAYYLRAKFELQRGRPRAALKSLERALLLDGKYPEAYLLLAQAKLSLRDLPGARAAVSRCIEIAPNLGRAYVVRAAVNEGAGRGDEVVADYRKALREFPYLFNPEQRSRMEDLLGGRLATPV